MTNEEACPFCGKVTERQRRLQNNVFIYSCENCGKITAAYSKDLDKRLKDFGNWYVTNTFKAQSPKWIGEKKNETS